jgi:hypothetical protein
VNPGSIPAPGTTSNLINSIAYNNFSTNVEGLYYPKFHFGKESIMAGTATRA